MRFDTIQTFDKNHFDNSFLLAYNYHWTVWKHIYSAKLASLGEATIELDFYDKEKSGGENV